MILELLRLPPAVRVRVCRSLSTTSRLLEDPRVKDLGKVIKDEYAAIRENYGTVSIRQSVFQLEVNLKQPRQNIQSFSLTAFSALTN